MKRFVQNHPYWYYSILTGVFIYIFLAVFKPLGFQNVPRETLNPWLNTKLVKRTFGIYKKNNFLTEMPDMYLDVLGNYPASFKCREN